jgi:hypothetical protein
MEPRRLVFALAAIAATMLATPVSRAGGVVARGGTHPHIDVESAWIVWEPASQREELIVSAQFSQGVEPFTWALPLPSHPDVGSVDVDLRLTLTKLIAAYQRRAPDWVMPSRDNRGPLAAVAFGDQGKVDSVVVQASQPDALPLLLGAPVARRWPVLDAWIERYARQEWEVVGLRLPIAGPRTQLPNVRMTFKTERPYYPYREPAWRPDDHTPGAGRVLRITVITPEQVAWKTGVSVPTMSLAWLSFEVAHAELQGAFGGLYASLFDPKKRYWLTSFEDWHEVRVGDDDVTFAQRAPMPADGAPGTLGDTTRKGLKLEPIEPAPAPAPSVEPPKRTREPMAPSAPGGGHRGRKLLVLGALVLLVAGAWAFAMGRDRSA